MVVSHCNVCKFMDVNSDSEPCKMCRYSHPENEKYLWRDFFERYSDEKNSCDNCKFKGDDDGLCWNCRYNPSFDDNKDTGEDMFEPRMREDVVNRPKHYCREGGMECIDEMVEFYGIDEVMIFCKLNVWKYRYRAADKNGEEDLKKSDWYARKYAELKKRRKESGEL